MPAPKVANFTTPGLGAPGAADAMDLASERALLLNALQNAQRDQTPNPINAGAFIVPDLGGLGAALAEKRARQDLEVNERKRADLQGKYQEGLTQALRAYRAAGEDKTVNLPGPTQDGDPLTGVVQANPRAYKQFLDSPYPEVRQIADDDRKLYDDRYDAVAKDADFGSRIRAGGDLSRLGEKDDLVELQGAMYNKARGSRGIVPETRVTQSKLSSGTVVNDYASGKQSSVDTAPKTDVKVDYRAPGQAADKEFLEQEAKKLSDSAERLRVGAPKQLAALERVEGAVDSGAILGPVSKYVQLAGGLAQQFGVENERLQSMLKNTEIINSDMGRFVLELVKELGHNPSNSDREYAAQIAGGTANTPEGLRSVIRAAKADILNAYVQHNKQVDVLTPRFSAAETAKVNEPPRFLGHPEGAKSAAIPPGVVKVPGYSIGEDGLLHRDQNLAPDAKPGAAQSGSPEDPEAKAAARMKALGLPYIPPARKN